MATKEDIDEAEELRYLALKSMVKRSRKKKSSLKIDEVDDPDILLLRAAALKTITNKKSNKNYTLVNENDKPVNGGILNEKKRSNSQVTPSKSKKIKKLNEKQNIKYTESEISSITFKNVSEHHHKCKSTLELQQSVDTVNKDDVKKVVRNGSIQLSNLDSEKVDETMVISITFSSSESDDSLSEYDYTKKNVNTTSNIKNREIKTQSSIKDILGNQIKTDNNPLEDNRIKMTNCLKTICELMKNCESEIEVRNQQLKILLDAYEKYENCNKSLYSILRSIKTARDELSICNSLVTKIKSD